MHNTEIVWRELHGSQMRDHHVDKSLQSQTKHSTKGEGRDDPRVAAEREMEA